MKRNIRKSIIWLIVIILLVALTWFVWPRLPILTAFAAKGMCSSVFLADKDPDRVVEEDLSFFPINLAKSKINYEEKSVTSTVFNLARRKAIYREGPGAVIVLKTPVEELKVKSFLIPDPGYSQDTIPWPKGNIIRDTLIPGVDYNRLSAIIDTCFDKPGEDPYKKTLGILIAYDNQIVAEKYLGDYDYNTMFHGWSMTKSVAGAMAGILSDQGKLDIENKVKIPEWQNDERGEMTVKNVIQMSSGLDWYENYFTISDATVMLMQSEDMLASVKDNELEYEPGTHWNYSSGDANLLSGIVRYTIDNDRQYHSFVYEKLFHPIGMLNTVVETDASGLFVASSYSYGSTRDWARFGLLFLNDGVFAGDTVLSKDWVEFMKTEVPASDGKYAGTFWLEEPEPGNELLDVPDDVFFADGFLGQRIYIIPSKKLVVVRMGYGLSNFSMNNFLREVIVALPGGLEVRD
jgi:CubicO group peptidase (beta-lactamase class C family)